MVKLAEMKMLLPDTLLIGVGFLFFIIVPVHSGTTIMTNYSVGQPVKKRLFVEV